MNLYSLFVYIEHNGDETHKDYVDGVIDMFYVAIVHGFNLMCGVVLRSRWPRGLRRRSAIARLLQLWVRIPSGA